MTLPQHHIKDIKLAPQGKLKIDWAGQHMPVLRLITERFTAEMPLRGITIGACLHVTSETANLVIALKAGGAKVALCASNPLSTKDDIAASLVKDFGIHVFAVRGENKKTYYQHLQSVLNFQPNITQDDGGDLISLLHKYQILNTKNKIQIKDRNNKNEWTFLGSCEETTTGVIRLKAMEKDGALKLPVLAVNNSDTKHLFDNRYGTGQSTIDGILRSTNILLAGKNFVVIGYGWCGRGVAMRAKGMGANVIVCEVDAVKALEAVMDGYRVMTVDQAAKLGNIFITVTGDKHAIGINHIKAMKDGVILANSGHFNVEIAVDKLAKLATGKRIIRDNLVEYKLKNKRIYLLADGRLVNLSAAEGHPAEVMDMSFANQALAAEYFVKHASCHPENSPCHPERSEGSPSLPPGVHVLPKTLDQMVAKLKLKAMGIKIDQLTKEQKTYLSSWQEGT